MWIKFKVITKINKWVNGKTTTVFMPGLTYLGLKHGDGKIVAFSPMIHKEVTISENDVFIVNE